MVFKEIKMTVSTLGLKFSDVHAGGKNFQCYSKDRQHGIISSFIYRRQIVCEILE